MRKLFGFISLFMCVIIVMNFQSSNSVSAYSLFDDNSAKSYVVVDESGNVLVDKNSNEKREVASICKLMTTLITLENIDNGVLSLGDKFLTSEKAASAEGSQAFLDSGCEYTISDLLKSVIVASANDSAIVLAEGIGGNENNFVNMMNARAKSLGMKNTKYSNSTGLPGGEQHSTAYDTSILLREVSKYDVYKNDCKIWMDKLIHPSGRETELVNTNRLIKYYANCLTGKTGFTDEAGYCLSSTAVKNNLRLTCVVLGCDNSADRFSESVELYNYAYANFVSSKIVDSAKELDVKINVVGGKEDSISIMPIEDYFLTQKIGEEKKYTIEYEIVDSIKAPILKGDKVGNLLIVSDGQILKSIDIVASEDVEKQTYKDVLDKIFNKFNSL